MNRKTFNKAFQGLINLQDWEGRAKEMVFSQIVPRGITDKKVIDALLNVPRHLFVPAHLQKWAYQDNPLPLGSGQTISQPYMVALMTCSLDVHDGMKVLEIGTGSGYQAAILARIGAKVHSLEMIGSLARSSSRILQELGYEVTVHHRDGRLGLPEEAPFDRIIVTAASETIPEDLLNQVSDNSIVVIPIRLTLGTERILTRRIHDGVYSDEWGEFCRFVPLLKETSR
jgi:protein-L-isoaspartate(D-aspartate) O-methyltransferase